MCTQQHTLSPYDKPEDFQRLYEETHMNVFRYIYSLSSGPQQDVEDLTGETFSRAWNARHRFQGNQQAALGWLLQIARNLVIDQYRRDKRNGAEVDIENIQLSDPAHSPEASTIHNQQMYILLEQLQTLPLEHRELLVLRYLLGWRVKDIGTHLDMLENTITVKIKRSLKKLRQSWPQEMLEGKTDG